MYENADSLAAALSDDLLPTNQMIPVNGSDSAEVET